MLFRILTPLVLVLATAALVVGPAHAQKAPDDSQVDQYVETIPGAGGDETTSPPGGSSEAGSSGDSGGVGLSLGASEGLSELGSDGQAAATLAEAASRSRSNAQRADGSASSGGQASEPAVTGDSSGLAAIFDQMTGGASGEAGGMGLLLPLMMLLLAGAGIAYLLRRAAGSAE